MSILYDYLKILESKKKQDAPPAANAPVFQKNNVAKPPYFIMGFGLLACLLLLFFLINLKPKAVGRISARNIVNAGEDLKFAPTDSDAQDLNSDKISGLGYRLEGIIYNSDSPFAIINGKLIEKNGKIDDWQVIEISVSEVSLKNTDDNSLLTLKLD